MTNQFRINHSRVKMDFELIISLVFSAWEHIKSVAENKVWEYDRKNRQNYGDAFFNLNQINQLEQRLRFCCLNRSYYFRSVKFHYIKETDPRYWVSSLSALEEIVAASQHKRQRKNLCQNLLRIENTDSDLKVHALHYANELLKTFCKLADANKRSNNKLSKIDFGYG